MRTRKEVVQYCMEFSGVFEDYPFHDTNWTCMRLRENRKIFAWIFEREGQMWVNVKCEPEWRDFWRRTYPSVLPAYHMNKTHWNSIILDGTVPEKEVKRMIGESYDLCLGKQKPSEFLSKKLTLDIRPQVQKNAKALDFHHF